MANHVPDRGSDPKRRPTPSWNPSLSGHQSAYDAAEYGMKTWMNSPAHRGAHEWLVHHKPLVGGGDGHTMYKYPRISPSIEDGKKGITAHHPAGAFFIPNENISEMHHVERDNVEPAWVREEKYRQQRERDGFQD